MVGTELWPADIVVHDLTLPATAPPSPTAFDITMVSPFKTSATIKGTQGGVDPLPGPRTCWTNLCVV